MPKDVPKDIPPAFPVETIRKWLALAHRRKDHLVDLYQSGRWRLYYSEAEFICRVREAVREIDRWSATERASATAEASDVGHEDVGHEDVGHEREWFASRRDYAA
ncbi:MAG: TIGR03809 family protein [Xanthobacteraceae bacterium]